MCTQCVRHTGGCGHLAGLPPALSCCDHELLSTRQCAAQAATVTDADSTAEWFSQAVGCACSLVRQVPGSRQAGRAPGLAAGAADIFGPSYAPGPGLIATARSVQALPTRRSCWW